MTVTLVVEDGSGLSRANSYVSVDDFGTFHGNRGRDTSGLDPEDMKAAMVKASEYVDKRFGKRYRGQRTHSDQGLLWPRIAAFDDDGFPFSGNNAIPRVLRNAVCEYALIVLQLTSKELLPNPALPFTVASDDGTTTSGGTSGRVIRQREMVGDVEEDTWYDGYNGQVRPDNVAVKSTIVNDVNIPEYPRADLWIEQIVVSSAGISLSRGD